LRTILEQKPNDAEIWMNLGDIAVYQGDELMARECYTRATEAEPSAEEIIAKAQKRLTLMAELSRGYQREGDSNP
jgi:cytochrome c-type biogenesis protein CcmH/NrfG